MAHDRVYIHVDGRLVPAWGPNTPSYARTTGQRGELVVGESEAKRTRAEAGSDRRVGPRMPCGHEMAYAGKVCGLPAGHTGHHLSLAAALNKGRAA